MNEADTLRQALRTAAATVAPPADAAETAVRRGRAAVRRRRWGTLGAVATVAVAAASFATAVRPHPVPPASAPWAAWPERGAYAGTDFTRRAARSIGGEVLWSGDTALGKTALLLNRSNGRPELEPYYEAASGGAGGQRSGLVLAAADLDPVQPPVLGTQLRPVTGAPVFAFLVQPGATSVRAAIGTGPWQPTRLVDGLAIFEPGPLNDTPLLAALHVSVATPAGVVYEGPVERARDGLLHLVAADGPLPAVTDLPRSLLADAVASWRYHWDRPVNVAVRVFWADETPGRRAVFATAGALGSADARLAMYVEGEPGVVGYLRESSLAGRRAIAAAVGKVGVVIAPPGLTVQRAAELNPFVTLPASGTGATLFTPDARPADDRFRILDTTGQPVYTGYLDLYPE